MAEATRRPLGRGRVAGTVRADGLVARTGEAPRGRAEWEGLFREPDWPPEDEAD